MSFKVVMIENEYKVRIKLDNLVIEKYEGEVWIPIDDISALIVDNLRITLTSRMLSTLAEHNVGVIFCNSKHEPIGFYCSYDNHSRISKTIKFQIEKNQEDYDEIWAEIIKSKLENQSKALEMIGKNKQISDDILSFQAYVTPGDLTNREAHAAKIYFNEMMGCSFSRGNEDILLNSGLDYGYAIIRSYIARLCVGYGLNTQIGIHHKNEYNRFNLVDDLMEPARPIVDIMAYRLLDDAEYFTAEHRHRLVGLLNHKIRYQDKEMFVCNMLEEYVAQFAAFLAGRRKTIVFPRVEGYLGDKDAV